MKRLISSLPGIGLGVMMALSAQAADRYDLKFQSSDPAGNPTFIIEQEWAAKVSAASGGRLNIEMLPVDSVVKYNETHDAVGAGILGGHITATGYISGKDPAFALIGNTVGAWSSPYEMLRYVNYGGGKALMNELLNPYGLHFIGATSGGLEAFVSSVPLDGVADLKGLKMRAPEGLVQEVFAAAGAAPVNLPGSEVFTSLDKKVIDAADYTVFSANHAAGMHDIARHPVYPGFHSMPLIEVSINKRTWDSMPEDLQNLLEISVNHMALDMTSQLFMKDLEAVADARKQGVTIHDWSQEERAKFRAIAKERWAKVAGRSANAKKVFDSLTNYMTTQGLLK
ncbi:MAG: TRAP transporter substrate-binding protein [Gammaproteobacteria bacterium]|nr:TRAP transporter substrate-binding protein [Gammaproteobacteria bacterium]MDD9814594.1 TRAP transporter substrate-binding protein [Gammaproteobacteria bacterium]MDD9852246.1 TRAP transporter substrate-binding protein [Gammaproteobacteria bacterium]MDD9871658.1 TRAP transporter substrate-binding protein [Gammaproteobacteria bacterium]